MKTQPFKEMAVYLQQGSFTYKMMPQCKTRMKMNMLNLFRNAGMNK